MNNSHNLLSKFTHDALSAYTHDNMIGVIEIYPNGLISTPTIGTIYIRLQMSPKSVDSTLIIGRTNTLIYITNLNTPYEDYANRITTTIRKPIAKIELLRDLDETPFKTLIGNISNGSLNIENKNGKRRAVSLTMNNIDSELTPSIDGYVWLQRKFKLYMGLEIDGKDYYFTQGKYIMDSPNVSENLSNKTASIKGVDKFGNLDGTTGGLLDSIFIIPSGTNIKTVLQSILTLSGDVQNIIFDNSLISETTPYTIIKEEGNTYGDIILELANFVSANVYYNNIGQLVFEKDINDKIKPTEHIFKINNDETNYQGSTMEYPFDKVINSVLVIGDNINGNIARAKVQNNDLSSPTSIPNINKELLLVIRDNLINTDLLAEERARYELKRKTNLLIEGKLNSIPLYHLDVDKVIALDSQYYSFSEKRFLINGINMSFGSNSGMTLSIVDSLDFTL